MSRQFTRRKLLGGAATASLAALAPSTGGCTAARSSRRTIKVAGYDYDRVKGIMDGRTGIEGVDVSFHYEDIYSVNQLAFGPDKTYEISELGLIPYVGKYINEAFRGYTLIPVFISRVFRHRNVFVRADAGIEKPEDLRGRRVGTPGYGMSAMTWIRGFLKDDYGIEAHDMHWIETTRSSDDGDLGGSGWNSFDEEGRSTLFPPADFPLEPGPPDVDESELLLSGGCDALITAITPRSFLEGHPDIKRLFADVKEAERDYFRRTGLFPIMHVVGIRKDAIEADPALPMAAFRMYQAAKEIAYADLRTTTSLKVSLPWVTQEHETTTALMGEDYWRYGIASNEKELTLVMRYMYEQGLVGSHEDFRSLFHPSTLDT